MTHTTTTNQPHRHTQTTQKHTSNTPGNTSIFRFVRASGGSGSPPRYRRSTLTLVVSTRVKISVVGVIWTTVWRPSVETVRDRQRPSETVRGHQRPSEAVTDRWDRQRPSTLWPHNNKLGVHGTRHHQSTTQTHTDRTETHTRYTGDTTFGVFCWGV